MPFDGTAPMRVLRAGLAMTEFFRRLSTAQRCALLLDYDGTLAPFHPDPRLAKPYSGVSEALDAVVRTDTRLIIISGRAIDDLLPLLNLPCGIEVWGAHGFERLRADGRRERASLSDTMRRELQTVGEWQMEFKTLDARIEHKPASIAIHWRGRAHHMARRIRDAVLERLRSAGSLLEPHDFDGGIELRAPGFDKGVAVNTVHAELGGDAVTAYLGDDQTDEEAFKALHDRGLAVLVRTRWRPTTADVWIKPPGEVLWFLQLWSAARRKP